MKPNLTLDEAPSAKKAKRGNLTATRAARKAQKKANYLARYAVRKAQNARKRAEKTAKNEAKTENELTHAQMRHFRRIENRDNRKVGSDNPLSGCMIPGELSPVEIAHKARRIFRRIHKAKYLSINSALEQDRLEYHQQWVRLVGSAA
jgi:hypothetical protein